MTVDSILVVFFLGLITALATGLGALPFAFLPQISKSTAARVNAVAAGMILGASSGLIIEGSEYGAWQTLLGAGAGMGFVLAGERLLASRADVSFGQLRGRGARQILLLLVVMTIHSFTEGVAVGVAFGGGKKLATLITIAIAVHNIPEGVAISTVMRARGASVLKCAGWSIFSSLPQPLMAVPAFVFVELFEPFLPCGLGFAAGAMVFMVFLELMPETYEGTSRSTAGFLVSATLGLMIMFQLFL